MNSSASLPTPPRMAVCLSVHRLEHLDRLAACFLTRREGGGRACHVFAADNRPVTFTKTEGDTTTIVECGYDYMGRRYMKKVTVNGVITQNHRYLYRGYLQIACADLTRSGHPSLWLITWDPTQPTATRPLAIQKNGTWYTCGHDLTKNVTELYNTNGTIASAYDYTPFGQVTATGTVDQPIQWSGEYNDTELGLIYYNYRHYNPQDGRWINRDPIAEQGGWNLYGFVGNRLSKIIDQGGLSAIDSTFKKLTEPEKVVPFIWNFRPDGSITTIYLNIKCCCNKIKEKYGICCRLVFDASMDLSLDQAYKNNILTFDGLKGLLGHEQKHMTNSINYMNKLNNELKKEKIDDFDLSENAKKRANEIEINYKQKIRKWLNDENHHKHDLKNKQDHSPLEKSTFLDGIHENKIPNNPESPKSWPTPTVMDYKKHNIQCP